MPASRIIELESDTFAEKNMRPDTCREEIVTVRIFFRAMYPELPVQQGADI